MKLIQVTITIPKRFYNVLRIVSEELGATVEEYVIEELISGLDYDLQGDGVEIGLWPFAGFEFASTYEDQLRALL